MMNNTSCARPPAAPRGLRAGLRRLLALAVAALATVPPVSAQAQDTKPFPSRPVTIVTAFSVGSGPDAMMRVVGEKLSRLWNQPVVIDNRPGGAGFISVQALKGARPDGYTLLMHESDTLSALRYLFPARQFRASEVLDPVGVLYTTPFMILVPSTSKWKSVTDLVAAAKGSANAVRYGTWGVGSSAHLESVLFQQAAGVEMLHVPYKEMSKLYTGLATGESDWAFGAAASAKFVLETGKARPLAVASGHRLPQFPGVPTIQEAGGPAFEYTGVVALLAPKGTPEAIRTKINADLQRAVNDPDTKARFATFGFEACNWTPREMQASLDSRSRTFGPLIEKMNLTLE